MAARRRKRAPQTEEYVEGNTVRKVERVPRYEEQERGHQQKRNVSHTVTVRRNQEKALQMNLFSVLLLTVAVICTLYICVSYLKLQSSVTARLNHIESLEAIEAYQVKLAEKQVRIAFQQAHKELDDLRQRTIEGLETARRSGKQLGRPRGRCITEKERKAKNIILKRDTLFGGDLCPSDCMKVIGISRGTYYKYRNDLSKFPIA